jgi:hypothetical protein
VLFALMMMYLVDIPIGLLSIGAIDFGSRPDRLLISSQCRKPRHSILATLGHLANNIEDRVIRPQRRLTHFAETLSFRYLTK